MSFKNCIRIRIAIFWHPDLYLHIQRRIQQLYNNVNYISGSCLLKNSSSTKLQKVALSKEPNLWYGMVVTSAKFISKNTDDYVLTSLRYADTGKV